MTSPALVVLAAGMGRRFGGDKQVAEVGPRGETILDLNALDAAAAGFESLVVVTRAELEADLRLDRFARPAFAGGVEIAVQAIPAGRTKPLGTADAVGRAAPFVEGPFAVANADDLYGRASFAALADHLGDRPDEAAVIGYRLGDTLSEEGAVSRAILDVNADGLLTAVTEASVRLVDADPARLVSMNLWAFPRAAFGPIAEDAKKMVDEGEDEARLPDVVNRLVRGGALQVRVLPTQEQWIGMTYATELSSVRAQVRARSR